LAHELPLRSTITFPEGMDAIYLGEQGGDLARRFSSPQPFEEMLVGQLPKYLVQLLFDQLCERKSGDLPNVNVISLCKRDRPELPRPLVNIPESGYGRNGARTFESSRAGSQSANDCKLIAGPPKLLKLGGSEWESNPPSPPKDDDRRF
jgi:hypothetical protein